MSNETLTGSPEAPRSTSENSQDGFVQVTNLWKVFGRDPKRILSPKLKNLSKDEIQEKTGCVVGMRNISLEIEKG